MTLTTKQVAEYYEAKKTIEEYQADISAVASLTEANVIKAHMIAHQGGMLISNYVMLVEQLSEKVHQLMKLEKEKKLRGSQRGVLSTVH